MSSIRKVEDFRLVEIESWDEYIEDEIAGMHARGEMDNLPLHGKPIKIWRTDVNPEYDLAFSRLKNAGVMPLWMELDKEIGVRTDELWARLDAVEAEIHRLIALLKSPVEQEPGQHRSIWQRLIGWFRADFANDAPPSPTISSIIATRARERRRFLEMAAVLDKRIVTYHDSLPRGVEHLQRLRWLPNRAETVFDNRIRSSDWAENITP